MGGEAKIGDKGLETIGGGLEITEDDKEDFRAEINHYREQLEAGEYPELPYHISLMVELAGDDYNQERYTNMAGVYSNREIKEALLDGHIRIYPYIEENLNGTSYDVTLGDWYYATDKTEDRDFYNFHCERGTNRYFKGPLRAVTNAEWNQDHHGDSFDYVGDMSFRGIPSDAYVVGIQDHERILAHTWEFVGINPPGTTQMQARSSYGRNGIVVCKDAGWGDPGFKNRWTMEIQNDNNERCALVVGSRVAQIIFYSSGRVEGSYGDGGKYYHEDSLINNIMNWHPEDMLPRSYEDEYQKPIMLEEGVEVFLRSEND